jgi:HK97 family phage portal protein
MGLLFGGRMAPTEYRLTDISAVDSFGRDIASGADPKGLRLIPLYSATRLIADQVASAPLRAYSPRADGARQVLSTQPVLLRSPQLFAWKYRAMTSLLLWGNAYGFIVSRDANGWPTQIVWLPPDKVTCEGDSLTAATYTFNGSPVPASDMLHIPAYAVPGHAKGVSPVGAFRLTIETGTSAQQYARDWYDGGGIPAAILRNETQTLDAEQARTVKDRLKATLRNGDPFVTGKDWNYEAVGAPAADMRFIETMKLTATQIANIYGVPPEEVGGETGSSMTYGTVELNQIKLNVTAVRPWAIRFEDALTDLFLGRTYVRFNLDAGIRADLKSRMEAHEIALRIGLETNPEGRSLEEKAPLTDEEVAQWQGWYVKQPAPPAPAVRAADPVTVNNHITSPDVRVDARTMPGAVQVDGPEVTVDARVMEGAVSVPIENNIDATTALLEDSIRSEVHITQTEPVTVEPTLTRKRVETDDAGRITAIIEERA